MSEACLMELTQLLTLAHTPGPQMLTAVEQLRAAESQRGFGVALLQLVQSIDIGLDIKQASCIYFKNFIARRWLAEPGMMAQEDRGPIKANILNFVIASPKVLRVQLCAALEDMVAADFPTDWPELLENLTKSLSAVGNPQALQATMEAAHSVFGRYRSVGRCAELIREARSCADAFGPAHLEVWKLACASVIESPDASPEHFNVYLNLLIATAQVYYDLMYPAISSFFKDSTNIYMRCCLALLEFNLGLTGADANAGTELLVSLKIQICNGLSLFACRYTLDFQPHVEPCLKAAWNLVVANLTEQLTTAAMGLLSAVVATEWNPSPVANVMTLQALCENVVLPNIQLKQSDVMFFLEDPQEFIRRDLEGADQDSPRRASIDLVRALRRHADSKVAEIIVVYASRLLEQAKGTPLEQEIICKDACMNLVMTLAGSINKSDLHAGILENFFNAQVVPELNSPPVAERALLRAACLKYITILRSCLPVECVAHVLPGILAHASMKNPVVHTYAAHCFSSLTRVQDGIGKLRKRRFEPQTMKPIATGITKQILQILQEGHGIPQNEHILHALLQLCDFLELHSACDMEVSLPALGVFAKLIANISTPMNPEYVHDVFECIAILVRGLVSTRNEEMSTIILPVLGTIWEQHNEDLLVYCLQIVGLILDSTPVGCIKPFYVNIFERMIEEGMWRNTGLVPALLRLLRAYFAKYEAFAEIICRNLQAIFARFQMLINHRKLGNFACELLNAVIRYLDPETYRQYLAPAISLMVTRLQAKKDPHLEKECSVTLFLLVHANSDPGTLPRLLEHIQPGLFQHVLSQVLSPGSSRALLLQRRKICIFGMVKLMGSREVSESQQLLLVCCESVAALLKSKYGLLTWLAAILPAQQEEPEANEDFEVPFSRLQYADSNPGGLWDPLPEIQDVAAGRSAVKAALACLEPAIVALGEAAMPLVEMLRDPPPPNPPMQATPPIQANPTMQA